MEFRRVLFRSAGAVARPALERAAQRRTAVDIVVLGPLVVAARHAVEHVAGDRFAGALAAFEPVLDVGGQREAGAGFGLGLVLGPARIGGQHPVARRHGDAGLVQPVAQVDRVRAHVAAARFAAARGLDRGEGFAARRQLRYVLRRLRALAARGSRRGRRLGLFGRLEPGVALLEFLVVAIAGVRSEEHTSELQSLMRISYAVFCLKKKKQTTKLYERQTTCTLR